MITIKNRGELLTKQELEYLEDNHKLTRHCIERMVERYGIVFDSRYYIENCSYAYFNTDGSINVVKNKHECMVFTTSRYDNNTFVGITVKDDTHHTMTEKRNLAIMGIARC